MQFDRIMKSSQSSTNRVKLLNGASYFKRGFFEQSLINIGSRYNCPKVNVPTLTIFYCVNLRQTQKDPDKDVYNYVEMKILGQVNKIRNASEEELEQAENKDPISDFLYCTYPIYNGTKLKGVNKHISMMSMLGDLNVVLFDNGFSSIDENKALWSRQTRKEMPNLFSCKAPSFLKRCVREGLYNLVDRTHIYCYAPRLCDRAEITNRSQNKPCVPFIQIDEKSF